MTTFGELLERMAKELQSGQLQPSTLAEIRTAGDDVGRSARSSHEADYQNPHRTSLLRLNDALVDETPADNEVLAYDSTEEKWMNQTAAEASLSDTSHSHTVDGLSDAVITSVADNEVLAYDSGSGNWINQTAAEASLATASHTHTSTSYPVYVGTRTTTYTLNPGDTTTIVAITNWSVSVTVPSGSPDLLIRFGAQIYSNTSFGADLFIYRDSTQLAQATNGAYINNSFYRAWPQFDYIYSSAPSGTYSFNIRARAKGANNPDVDFEFMYIEVQECNP